MSVSLVVDKCQVNNDVSQGLLWRLVGAGVAVVEARGRGKGKYAQMHMKMVAIDGECICTGSLNLTNNGVYQNSENVYIANDPGACGKVEQMYAEEEKRSGKKLFKNQRK